MPEDIKSQIPGQWWGAAFTTLPKPRDCGPACIALDVPGFGPVRFFVEPWSYNVHGARNWAWAVRHASRATGPTYINEPRDLELDVGRR